MKTISVVGMDPSLRNWGLAFGTYDLDDHRLHIQRLEVVNPVFSTAKTVRQNSKDLEQARQLAAAVTQALTGAQAVFVEVPVGSQSARAMASYGICIGILGSLRAQGFPFFELTPTEVKLAATGNKNATKAEMIAWARDKYPQAPWPTYTHKGQTRVSETVAEHMADAVGAIHAGLQCNAFQNVLPFLRAA